MLRRAVPEAGGFRVGARSYQALLLDPLPVASPELVEAIVDLAESGVPVMALGDLPVRAPGWREAERRDRRVRAAVERLRPLLRRVDEEKRLARVLEEELTGPALEPLPGEGLRLSLESRETPTGLIIHVFNESWSSRREHFRFARDAGALTLWDPWTGQRKRLKEKVSAGEEIQLELQGTESMILTLGRAD